MRRLIIVILSVGYLAGAQALAAAQAVGDRVRVTTATGVVTGRVSAITESALDLSLDDGESESFGRDAILRLERSNRSRTTRSLHGFLLGTGAANLAWSFGGVEGDRRKMHSETDAIAGLAASGVVGGLVGAAIGLVRGEAWEDIAFGSTEVAASHGRRTLVGVRAGYGYSSHTGLDSSDGIARMIAGVDVAVPVRSGIELRIGAAFAPRGYGSGDTFETDYVQGSVLARAGTPRDGGLSAGLLFGPWVAFGLSCSRNEWDRRQNIIGGGYHYYVIHTRPCGEESRPLDFGIMMGAGVEVPFRTSWIRRLDIDLGYSMGLGTHTTHIVDDILSDLPELVDESGFTGRTRHLTIQTGFVIPVGN